MDYVKELRKVVGHRPLILPGAVVIILNGKNELLLQNRNDGGWGLPGGLMEMGESIEETARREVKEETNLEIEELQLMGIFSGEEYFFKIDNGDEFYSVTAVYATEDVKGDLAVNKTEASDLQYFHLNHLPDDMAYEYRSYITPFVKKLLKVGE
ncbi:NUDIX hydrolase [Virgibacillus kekensis]|uniref:NUDIX hydrolase n=1 Tax=Virgibacillus kekensis TaxID=202261 RepID=A0ABV9DJJ7_9BACI